MHASYADKNSALHYIQHFAIGTTNYRLALTVALPACRSKSVSQTDIAMAIGLRIFIMWYCTAFDWLHFEKCPPKTNRQLDRMVKVKHVALAHFSALVSVLFNLLCVLNWN